MSLQLSMSIRNARLDAIETVVGTTPVLRIFDGTKPAFVADADVGTVLATINLPSDWMAAASNASKVMAGTWEDSSADNTGTADYFRVYASDGTTCHMQGTVGGSGSGADMIVSNVNFAAGQPFTVTQFTIGDGNS